MKYSRQAIIHSNVAGRTDLSGIEFALGKRRKELLEQIAALLAQLNAGSAVSEVFAEELGETLPYTGRSVQTPPLWPSPLWPYV
jgi:hypothetical protein